MSSKRSQFSPKSKASAKSGSAVPQSWLLSLFPGPWRPFLELIRIQKPAGIMAFYFPILQGSLLAALFLPRAAVEPFSLFMANVKFAMLMLLARSVLCAWNDIIDQDVDRKVARTCQRPLPRHAISTRSALIFTSILASLTGWVFCTVLPGSRGQIAVPFIILHTVYPFTKRIMSHPQAILGIALAGGTIIAFPALGLELGFSSTDEAAPMQTITATCFGVAVLAWTLLFDTIYAAQDVEDDRKAGVGSTMVYYQDKARWFLRVLALLQLAMLTFAGLTIRYVSHTGGVGYFFGTCGGTAMTLKWMVEGVNLDKPDDCGWWFTQGNMVVGLVMTSGLAVEYGAKLYAERLA